MLPNELLLCGYKMKDIRIYTPTDYGQGLLLQMRRQILNIGATLQPNFKYSPTNVKVLHRYSNETADLFFKRVQKCRVLYLVLKTTWIIHAETLKERKINTKLPLLLEKSHFKRLSWKNPECCAMLIISSSACFSYTTCCFLQLLLRKSLKQIHDVE